MVTQEETESYLDDQDNQDVSDRIEDQQEEVENNEWAEVPQKKQSESLYSLFNRVWRSKDSSKVANIDKHELGKYIMTVRDAQYLALLGATLNHKGFAQFFMDSGEITLSTSASKKGWFTELFVSQKKFTNRLSSFGAPENNLPKKKGIFSLNSDANVSSDQG